jgi:hypothetical protein
MTRQIENAKKFTDVENFPWFCQNQVYRRRELSKSKEFFSLSENTKQMSAAETIDAYRSSLRDRLRQHIGSPVGPR